MKNIEDVTHIDLVFENCEVISIPRECIEQLYIGNIQTSISISGGSYVYEHEEAQDVWFMIDPKANTMEAYPESHRPHADDLPFDRIMGYSNLTHLDLLMGGESIRYLAVAFPDDALDDDNPINTYQTQFVGKNGHLYVCVSRTKTAKQIFEMYDQHILK